MSQDAPRLDLDGPAPVAPEKLPRSEHERRDWLRLARSENVGPVTFLQLMRRFASAAEAIEAIPEMAARGGARRRISIWPLDRAEAELDAAERAGARMLCLGAPDYPGLLARIDGPPPLLWALGDPARISKRPVAVVGARNASAIGRRFAAGLARALARDGATIVSGLARGIDAAAHEGALEEAGGTVAVVAGAVDHIYPPEHAALHARIAQAGVVVSEMPMGFEPTARSFPRRNRLISGVAAGVAVIEAAERSGSLITARYAAEQGREAMAAPGHPSDPRAGGCNALIREGAALIRSAEDVREALAEDRFTALRGHAGALEEPSAASPQDTGELRERLLDLLSVAPVEIDELIRQSGAPSALVASALLELELAGRIARSPGGLVAKSDHEP